MIELACPTCHGGLLEGDSSYHCDACGAEFETIDGINRFLPADRVAHFEAFLRDYTTVRIAEGRASEDPSYFRRLPEPTIGGPMEEQWKIRRRSWQTVRSHVIHLSPPALRIVDVGAGVGWLSNRLLELGHDPHAVDLTVDPHDGLGAARHFEHSFPCSQAEMDSLPFADGSVDVVIYNASLHYSSNYHVTLAEALRVLAAEGRIVVMDSPVYRKNSAGDAMVAERHVDFEQRFGSRSDSVPSVGYITPDMLADLASSLGLRWKHHRTWYGLRWAWRPWRARLRGRRQPSRFVVLEARRYFSA
jgi:SAM-dependent methyltransferase